MPMTKKLKAFAACAAVLAIAPVAAHAQAGKSEIAALRAF